MKRELTGTRVPHILTYGLEGLEGLRVGTADALEIRIGYYANLICERNADVKSSLIDLDTRRGNKGQAEAFALAA
jgi:hypothetical protein